MMLLTLDSLRPKGLSGSPFIGANLRGTTGISGWPRSARALRASGTYWEARQPPPVWVIRTAGFLPFGSVWLIAAWIT